MLRTYRNQVLVDAERAGWAEVCLPGVGYVAGELSWRTEVEAASGHELISLAKALVEAAAT